MTLVMIFLICGAAMLGLGSMQTYILYFFGTKHIGVNYGWMFSAYGTGGFFGPFLAAWLMKKVSDVPYQVTDNAGNIVQKTYAVGEYGTAFFVAGIICLIAAILIGLTMKKPVPRIDNYSYIEPKANITR